MQNDQKILKKIAPILVYGRPPLVFAGMICAMAVMLNRDPLLYLAGILLFFVSTVFDLVDGWFAVRFIPNTTLAQLADRMMNRVVYSIVFPLLAVGMMWRLVIVAPEHSGIQLLHAIVVLILCVTVLIRDNFAHFMRGYGERYGQEPELRELNRLRTIVAAPLGLLLYIYAFFVPAAGEAGLFYSLIDRLGNLPVRNLFIIEILFLIINFASIAGYCRKYGSYFLDDLCMDDNLLRRRILSVFPNALTLMNAIMGLLAVFFAAQGKMTESYLLIMGAAVFDKLDGAMARKLGLTEPPLDACNTGGITFGGLLDDIADGVSFCIAPGWIVYLCLSAHPVQEIRALPLGIAAVVYVLAGFARLVYFTRDPNPIPGIFKGLPTPAAALFVTAPLIVIGQADGLNGQWDIMVGYLAFGLLFFSAFLMNLYPVRYIHMGRFMDRNPWFTRTTIILTIVFVFTPFFGYFAFLLMFFYLLSPLLTRRMDPGEAARESRT
ncbi:MAG: CDP-alcohol phosphatidyltransferase family protein [Thermodesulfobacteriota bacterium]